MSSKREIALVQLRRAVQLYAQGDFVCALTLAGASEEILGGIARRAAGTNALGQELEMVVDLLADAKGVGLQASAAPRKALVSRRNMARNQAKHPDDGDSDRVVSCDFHLAAEEMIDRALRNWAMAFGGEPPDRVIARYIKLHY